MLSSITPVGEDSRSQRWTVTVVAFTIGSVLGGAATGVVAGAVGVLLGPSTAVSAGVLAVATVATIVADRVGLTPPSLRRQVDRTWMLRYRGWVYGFGYGLQLGCGLVTYITSWSGWLWVLALVVVGDLRAAVVLGAVFGLVRGVSLWTTAGLTTPQAIRDHHRRLVDWAPRLRMVGQVALVVVAVGSVAGVVAALA